MNPKTSRYFTYIRPILRSKTAKTYSSLVFSLIAIAIFSYFAIKPTVATILSLQKSITERNQVLTDLIEKVKNLKDGKDNLKNINPKTKLKIEALIPGNPALPGIIDSLTFAANEAQASISGIQFQSIVIENEKNQLDKNAPMSQVDFVLNTQGEFANLMKLLTILKRSDRLFDINSINFAKPVDGALVMSVNAKAFFIKN